MYCTICNKGLPDGVTIHRNNEKGVKAIWRCWDHLDRNMKDEELKELTDIIEEAGKTPNNKNNE